MDFYQNREKGDIFCPKHRTKELIFSCDDCADTPVCSLCISTEHKGHKCTDLDLLAKAKYNFIQDFNNEIQTENTITKIADNIQIAEYSVSLFEKSISAEISRVEGQRQFLMKTIEDIAKKNISDLKDILRN